ncbi:MAG TPA: carboxypeptidase regulatory-like domain-containing protein [Galbitalea sp.]|jgi:hypothetical protein|nr:carboxypeptidase regulatory-like domain-containing protein [Galbitalea sp.]
MSESRPVYAANRRRTFVALLAVLAVVVALLSVFGRASSARADGGTASVAGTVTDASESLPLADVSVQITSDDYTYFDSTTTADDGTYSLSTIPAGNYTLQFIPAGGSNYVQQCWQNDSCLDQNQTYFAVVDGAQLTGYDAALQPGGTMTGTVVTANSPTTGIANVSVNLQADDGNNAGGTTDANGNFTITGIPADDYQVDFQPGVGNFIGQWWDNQPTETTAQYVTVGSNATVNNINAALASGGIITGTVTDANGPVRGVRVTAFGPDSTLGDGKTNAAGKYRISALTAGSYTVEFIPPKADNDALQYWNDANTPATATPITVNGTTTTGVNATLVAGASVTGRVLAPGTPNTGVADADVSIYPAAGGQNIASALTNANGVYHVTGLPAGSYSVSIVPSFGAGVAPEWWGGTFIQTGAKTLTLTTGQALTHVNQRLIVGSVISGTIYAGDTSTPEPFADIQVFASDQLVGSLNAPPFEASTDGSGNYTLPNLGPGKYTLFIGSEDQNYVSQWWNGKASQAKGTALTVHRNIDVSGVDATLALAVITPGTPTISGRAKVGDTLTAHKGSWQPRGLIFSYQWLRNGSPIAHATASTYVPTSLDVGATIAVAVTGEIANFQSQGKTDTVTSAATAAITN